jgi:predicted phosphodiesterase
VLHAGDILDGCYDHGRWELSHHGLDKQIDDAIETLPRLDGLRYVAISGNHDETFTKSTGMDTGRAIVDRFRSEGRTDLEYVGPRGAMLRLGGVRIELWHPRQTSAAYSLSYRLQNKIRDTSVGRKPDLLLAGHWHTSVYLEQRGVHALACGTFQGGGSAFSKSLGGAPSIGGTLISWETTEHGTLRRVAVERSAYYENEAPREIA